MWLSSVDDEEVGTVTAAGELNEEEVVEVAIGLVGVIMGLVSVTMERVGVTWLVLSVEVVVEESWVGTKDEIEVVRTSDEV